MKTTTILAAALVCALAFTTAQAQQVPIPTSAAEVPGPAAGTFSLFLRSYWPDQAILDGTWMPPQVLKSN